MNSCRQFSFLRHRGACNLQLAESGQSAAVAGEDSGSANHSGDSHTGRLPNDAVPEGWFLPFADTVEVEQSQVAVANIHTQYTSSLGDYDHAKLSLVRTLRVAEEGV